MGKRWRYVVGAGVAVIAAVAIGSVVSARDSGGADSAATSPAARTPSRTVPRASWVAEANAVCRLGRKLYPNIALGSEADPDTIDYAVGRLVTEIAAIATSPPSGSGELEAQGRAAVAAWRSLATSPVDTVALPEKQEAARTAARYVDQLVALGAAACEPLRLSEN